MTKLIVTAAVLALLSTQALKASAELYEVADHNVLTELHDQAFQPWFDAVQTGDLSLIGPLLSAETYAQYQALFEQNTEYGQFLRDYYSGASFQLLRVYSTDAGYLGETLVHWPDGSSSTMRLLASPSPDAGGYRLTPQ